MESKEHKSVWYIQAEADVEYARRGLHACVCVRMNLEDAIQGVRRYFTVFGDAEGGLHTIDTLRAVLEHVNDDIAMWENKFAKAVNAFTKVVEHGPRF